MPSTFTEEVVVGRLALETFKLTLSLTFKLIMVPELLVMVTGSYDCEVVNVGLMEGGGKMEWENCDEEALVMVSAGQEDGQLSPSGKRVGELLREQDSSSPIPESPHSECAS